MNSIENWKEPKQVTKTTGKRLKQTRLISKGTKSKLLLWRTNLRYVCFCMRSTVQDS